MIETIKNLANIVFFVVVALVTILSYLQARKTIFAPIRTETFKLQLKVFEEILLFFQNKSEHDFIEAFDYDRIASLNTLQMADSYVAKFFDGELEINKEEREKALKPLIAARVSHEFIKKYFEKVDAETPVPKQTAEDKKIKNPALILANWHKYEHGMIGYTKEYTDQVKELTRLSASPLVPKPLREKIVEFQKLADHNLSLIGKTITECSRLMPEHFPVASDMKGFSSKWVWNEFNRKRNKFEPLSKEILDFMNGYLKIENIMQ